MQESNKPEIESVIDFGTYNKSYRIDNDIFTTPAGITSSPMDITNTNHHPWSIYDPSKMTTYEVGDDIIGLLQVLFEVSSSRDKILTKIYKELKQTHNIYRMAKAFFDSKSADNKDISYPNPGFISVSDQWYTKLSDKLPLIMRKYEKPMYVNETTLLGVMDRYDELLGKIQKRQKEIYENTI